MHDRGHSQLEQIMYENSAEYAQPGNEALYEAGYSAESPLNEILAAEAPLAAEYHEAPMQHEAWGPAETAYHEFAPEIAQEHAAFEAPFAETYGETYGEFPAAAEFVGETPAHEWHEVLAEEEELALAAELLELNSEEEIDRFLGKLVRRVSRGVRGFIRSPVGRMLGGVLRRVAKVALPIAGRALGTFVGGPAGAMIGGQLAGVASQTLGLELQEMSAQEADFATARQFVRFATDMMRRAQATSPAANPTAVVRQAVQGAARQFAPGLLSRNLPPLRVAPVRGGRRGVWVRRGPTITLYGV
jgi:hypothetical protein